MGKLRIIVSSVFLSAFIGGLVWVCARSSDPVYKNTPLSDWLKSYDPRILINNKDEVDDAVRHIGTNGIPTLLNMLRARESVVAQAVKWAERKDWIWVSLAEEKHVEGARGFEVLGASAKDAVPALIEIYNQNSSPESRAAVAYSLGFIGQASQKAIPQLIEGATNADKILRSVAVRSLGQIKSQPGIVVPVFVVALNDSDQFVRYRAAEALGAFGTNAMPAVPALIASYNNQSSRISKTAATALKAIDPDAASKAGIK